jgi:hypothetical protein
MGYSYYDRRDFAEAADSFGALIERAPSAEAYLGRGNARKALGQPDEAIADFEQAIALDENYLDAYTGLGDIFYETSQPEAALEAYQQYLERAGDTPYDYVPPRVEELEAQLASPQTAAAYVEGDEIFYDDFEDGEAEDWQRDNRARVALDDEGNYVLRMISLMGNNYVSAAVGDTDWDNYALEFRVNVIDVAVASSRFVVGANVRADPAREGCNRYYVAFEEWGAYVERLGNEDVCPLVNLVEVPNITLSPQEWHTVRVEVYESNLTVFIDGEPVMTTTVEDEPLLNGLIGLEAGRGTTADFDDVRVVELISPDGEAEQANSVTAVVQANSNLRNGPGGNFALVGTARAGEQLTVLGRNARGGWLFISTASGEEGWILTSRVELQGRLAEVPVMNR